MLTLPSLSTSAAFDLFRNDTVSGIPESAQEVAMRLRVVISETANLVISIQNQLLWYVDTISSKFWSKSLQTTSLQIIEDCSDSSTPEIFESKRSEIPTRKLNNRN